MSLYGIVLGENKNSELLLEILGFKKSDIPRYRDCYLERIEDQVYICIHTRTGGGNRPDYLSENESLRNSPFFFCDKDDEYDSTFCNFYYTVRDLNSIKNIEVPLPARERWKKALSHPIPDEIIEKLRPTFDKIKKSLKETIQNDGDLKT